jgi:hypothetical protein
VPDTYTQVVLQQYFGDPLPFIRPHGAAAVISLLHAIRTKCTWYKSANARRRVMISTRDKAMLHSGGNMPPNSISGTDQGTTFQFYGHLMLSLWQDGGYKRGSCKSTFQQGVIPSPLRPDCDLDGGQCNF